MISEWKKSPVSIHPNVTFRLERQSTSDRVSHTLVLVKWSPVNIFRLSAGSGLLFLLADGTRTVEQIVEECSRRAKIQDSHFSKSAYDLIDSLLKENILEIGKRKIEGTLKIDLIKYQNEILKNTKHNKVVKAKSTFISRPHKGDRKIIKDTKRTFSKLINKAKSFSLSRSFSISNKELHIFCSEISFKNEKIGGCGAGFTALGAAHAAVGEAIERSFISESRSDMYGFSYRDLKRKKICALDPGTVVSFSKTQGAIKNGVLKNLGKDDSINWAWFEDPSKNGKATLIPSEVNGGRPYKNRRNLYGDYTGSGCALAADPYTAQLKAILELIERDNLLFYWRTRIHPQEITLNPKNKRELSLLNLIGSFKNQIKLFYLRSDIKAVTVQAVFVGRKKSEPRFVSTSACRMDPSEAAEKAIVELFYVLSGVLGANLEAIEEYGRDFDNSIWDFDDHLKYYALQKSKEPYSFLIKGRNRRIELGDIENFSSGHAKKDLTVLLKSMKKRGIRIFLRSNGGRNLNRAGFWVYRAYSPDLILAEGAHKYRQMGLKRFKQLAKYLKKEFRKLSEWPHPLP